jgi:hypothetical protein
MGETTMVAAQADAAHSNEYGNTHRCDQYWAKRVKRGS